MIVSKISDKRGVGYTIFRRNDEGDLHSFDDLPAIEHSNGILEYWKNGKLDRDGDRPAIIHPNGTEYYYRDGELHRDGDKPAIIKPDGEKEYYKNGKRHRLSGPAYENAHGWKFYYVEDEEYNYKDFLKKVKLKK